MHYTGGCHCGALEIALDTDLDPATIEVRECQCSFCRRHASRAIADPDGQATLAVNAPDALRRYTFGLKTAEFMLCATCGVYVAAVTNTQPRRAIIIVNALTDREKFTAPPKPSVYDDEDQAARTARRAARWTPITIIERSPARDVALRPAIPADADGVSALMQASCPTLMAPAYDAEVLAAALPLMTTANRKLLGSGTYYVVQATDGEIIGAGGWTHDRPGTGELTPGLAHIRHFATHPDHTGKGIGRTIYDQCQSAARAEGITQLECYASLNAEPFYAALGFERVRPVAVPMGPDLAFPSVLMHREI